MEYIREGATLPVPFNIIPTPKSFYYLFLKLVNLFKKKSKKEMSSSSSEPAAVADGGMARGNNGLAKNVTERAKNNFSKLNNQPENANENNNSNNKRAGRKESNDGLTYIVKINV